MFALVHLTSSRQNRCSSALNSAELVRARLTGQQSPRRGSEISAWDEVKRWKNCPLQPLTARERVYIVLCYFPIPHWFTLIIMPWNSALHVTFRMETDVGQSIWNRSEMFYQEPFTKKKTIWEIYLSEWRGWFFFPFILFIFFFAVLLLTLCYTWMGSLVESKDGINHLCHSRDLLWYLIFYFKGYLTLIVLSGKLVKNKELGIKKSSSYSFVQFDPQSRGF